MSKAHEGTSASDRADHARTHRRTRDRAIVLLLSGVVLLSPPVAGIFQLEARIAGVPLTLIYLFVVWGGLIFGASRLAPRLRDTDPESDPGAPGATAPKPSDAPQ